MFGGELIHQETDNLGSIEVIDYQQKIRSLHFGNKTQQSAMLLNNPFLLIHKYTQAMMVPLSWINPQRVLILGLGSGSMVKYLYNYFPQINIDAVELRPKVIQLAREYFLLPDCDGRLQIYNESSYEWLDKNQTTTQYDFIIVDMFLTSKSGKDITIDVSAYVEKLSSLLSDDGVAVFNQLSNNIYSYAAFDALMSHFKHHLYTIEVDENNSVLLATRSSIPTGLSNAYFYELESNYSLPYLQYFKKIHPVFR